MAYTALYRKWRPVCFEEVKGQDPIVNTLKNQLMGDRVGHAYLFCGTRGTGKTTIAKIFARAVNCEHPVNGSPCNVCASCQAIRSGASMNVVEIDAASNNGVENIRDIRDDVRYSPTEGRYRVYIIDEVHMLSAGAFNALLKTLEEPPSYVIFILATTEAHRCQRYDFKRITNDVIGDQIANLCREEGVSAEPAAIRYIARAADGSMRDALSLLEQCISFHYGKTLTYENVLDVLGAVDTAVFSRLLRCVISCQVGEAMACVEEVVSQGRELVQFTADFTWYMRNLLLMQTTDPQEEAINISSDNMAALREESHWIDTDTLIRYIRIVSELGSQMRYAVSKRVLLEVALIRMMKPAMEYDVDSLRQRIIDLEERLAQGDFPSRAPDAGPSVQETPNDRAVKRAPQRLSSGEKHASVQPVRVSEAEYADYQMLANDWRNIIEEQDRLIRSALRGTVIHFEPEKGLRVVFFDPFYKTLMQQQKRTEELNRWLTQRYGKQFHLTMYLKEDENPLPDVVREMDSGVRQIPGIHMEIGQETEDGEGFLP